MNDTCLIGAIVLTLALLLAPSGAPARDASKYPNPAATWAPRPAEKANGSTTTLEVPCYIGSGFDPLPILLPDIFIEFIGVFLL